MLGWGLLTETQRRSERADGDGVFPRRDRECPADSLVLTVER